ncbi:MAG: hypothetical protein CUN55_12315 [Phototrophicales bacterium]|nr:MAG: hypothetical protein CUN55_12315 [Phototrophicales bacterium]
MPLKPIYVKANLPFYDDGNGNNEVAFVADDAQQRAAWKLYVEFETRVVTQMLGDDEGILREALDSLYKLFQITRDILREAGPEIANGPQSLGPITIQMLNKGIRPVTAKWHPLLKDYEEKRPPHKSVAEYEREWEKHDEMRARLKELQVGMTAYVRLLAKIVGAE